MPTKSHAATTSSSLRSRWFLGTLMQFHVTGEDSQGVLTAVEQLMPKGFSPPRHVHAREAALIYVLDGTVTVDVGGDLRTVHASQCAFLPQGVPHTFRSEETSRILEVTLPGGVDGFYAENSVPAERPELPPAGPLDIPRLTATAKARQIDIIGPPMGNESSI